MSIVLDGTSGITTNSGTVVSTTDATLNGLTVGKGGSSVSTNTALGVSALASVPSSSYIYNTAIGYQALTALNGGSQNTACGYTALVVTTTGGANASFGDNSLKLNTTGSYNTALGSNSFPAMTTGAGNTAIGESAGKVAATGNNSTFVGQNGSASGSGNSHEIVIGCNTTGKGSNTGFIQPNGGGVYQGNNSATWSVTSDQRLKKNIVDNTEGLDIVSQIRVRNFEYRTAEEVTELPTHTVIEKTGVQLGVIAQELQEVCGDCVKTESTGVMSVNQDNITWHLVNAIKDLKTIVDAQAAEIAELKAKG